MAMELIMAGAAMHWLWEALLMAGSCWENILKRSDQSPDSMLEKMAGYYQQRHVMSIFTSYLNGSVLLQQISRSYYLI